MDFRARPVVQYWRQASARNCPRRNNGPQLPRFPDGPKDTGHLHAALHRGSLRIKLWPLGTAAKPIGIVPERVGRCQQARAPWTIVGEAASVGSRQ